MNKSKKTLDKKFYVQMLKKINLKVLNIKKGPKSSVLKTKALTVDSLIY